MPEALLDRLPEVAREIGAATHLLLCLDFDGTLAPIVPDPADARMPGETRAALGQLISLPGATVAIVSGRAAEDLQTRVGMNVILAGNHGLEIIDSNTCWRHPAAAGLQPVLHEICGELVARVAKIPGALVEDKGLTASLHYRNVASADVPLILEVLNTVVAPHEDSFFVRNGKKIFEILPKVPWDKGSAVLRILECLRKTCRGEIAVCYIGDDTTDEYAFRQLPDTITVRVGENCPTAARFGVRDPVQVAQFLDWLGTNLFFNHDSSHQR
jgi:trehalose 6-phosphate phosphatase